MADHDAIARFDDAGRPALLRAKIARARWAMSAAIGFTWGPAIMFFIRHATATASTQSLAVLGLCSAGFWAIGHFAPPAYFRIPQPKIARRFYRKMGVRWFRRWMMDGDLMNSRLRRLVPGYRVIAANIQDIQAYAIRSTWIERRHLEWLLLTLPVIVFSGIYGQWGFAVTLSLLNAVTNLLPIFLQRFNRARCEAIVQDIERRPYGPVAPRFQAGDDGVVVDVRSKI